MLRRVWNAYRGWARRARELRDPAAPRLKGKRPALKPVSTARCSSNRKEVEVRVAQRRLRANKNNRLALLLHADSASRQI